MSGVGEIQVVARDDESNGERLPAMEMQQIKSRFSSEEFFKKRSDDLNIILIVAGLLSAVISAFVVFIQPQLQQDPGEDSAALLRVILYNMNKTAFGTTVPAVPDWTGPSNEIIATQVLLYLSLAFTLSSVLFALLAKQLSDTYDLVDSGDIEVGEESLSDIRVSWFALRFLLLLLPFNLQFGLLFAYCALTVYLWKVSVVVSRVVLVTALAIMPFYLIFIFLAFLNLWYANSRGLLKRISMYSLSSVSNSVSVLPPTMCMIVGRAKIPYFRGDRYDA
ncbi:hypothetical protein BJ322DRAFT_1043227 [Thelephora terrestris]|uniref:DUF6535 domain-containing protein n=1 Tax=Thelephora terrestris TaxID=56493 RepID=A0A9P6HKW0_9AGAM|nr:hypothetical protein BJ322DRAFT_1043227 [Thelephora terrestris]